MRILMLTQLFQPEPNHLKGLGFARELMRRGHDVEVLTGFPNYPGGRVYAGYRMRWRQREVLDGVPVVRLPLYPSHSKSGVHRFLCYGSFALAASSLGLSRVTRPDVVHVYQGPATLAWPAMVMRWLWGVPYVLDVQDIWPDSVAASGMMALPGGLRLLDLWCRLTYRLARRIVVLSPGYKAALVSRGVPEDKIDVVFNWSDEGQSAADGSAPAELLGAAGRFNVVFAGNFGTVQALEAVIRAAGLLRGDLPEVQFVLIGDGVEAEPLKKLAEDTGAGNVTFIPRQPASAIGRFLAAADVLLIHLRDNALGRIGIPQKTQAYLAAGRPILMAVRGDSAELVSRAGAGLVCEPENPASIADAVRRFVAMSVSQREAMGQSGRRFYEQELSFAVGLERMTGVFQRAVEAC